MAARRFTAFLCWGVARERDVLNLLGLQATARRQQFLRELVALGASEASRTPPAVESSGEPCESERVVLHLHPDLKADAATIDALQSVALSRRSDWLRHLLVVGHAISRRGQRAPLAITSCDIELDIHVDPPSQESRAASMRQVASIENRPAGEQWSDSADRRSTRAAADVADLQPYQVGREYLPSQDIPSADANELDRPNDLPSCSSAEATTPQSVTGRPRRPELLRLFQ